MAGGGPHQGGGYGVGFGFEEFGAGGAVAKLFDNVGGGDDEGGCEGRVAEDAHEAFAYDTFVAEEPEEPDAVECGVGEFPVVEQAGVGVGGGGEPFHEGGQQHCLDFGFAVCPGGECGEVFECTVGVEVAEGPELFFCRGCGEFDGVDAEVDHRIQEGPVEQFVVERGDAEANFPQFVEHFFDAGLGHVSAEAGGVGEPAEGLVVGFRGEGVGAFDFL